VTTNKKEIDIADLILICLYDTLCRMADEIGMALSQGSTTSALAQWRTFYEHIVVGIFLMDEDSPELFKKFADFSH